jgi:predicted DNA-binding ribbon-helix-helix protein
MCDVYTSIAPERYESTTRSIRLKGFVTSIRLENEYWGILNRMAQEEGLTAPQFICQFHEEVLAKRGDVQNLTSMLRVACAIYISQRGTTGGRQPAKERWPLLS